MKTPSKIAAIITALTAVTSLTACKDKVETEEEQTAQTSVVTETYYESPVEQSFSETEPVETEPEIDMTTVPSIEALSENVYNTLGEMTGFEMSLNIKGFIPDDDYFSSSNGKMIDHSFTLSATTDMTHLVSETTDLNTGESSTYEEYQTLSDNIVTTITPYNNKWVDNTPKEMIRYDMMTKSYTSLPLIGIFANNISGVANEFSDYDIERSEEGDYILTVKSWTMENYESDFGQHALSGLYRSTTITDILANTSLDYKDGDCIYTFDKNYIPVSISFDIMNPNNYNADLYGLDVHGEVKFAKWNNINDIYLPKISSVEDAESGETDTEETTAAFTSMETTASTVVTTMPAVTETTTVTTINNSVVDSVAESAAESFSQRVEENN